VGTVTVTRLFPVECPGCGRPTDHDGNRNCSVVLANLKAAMRKAVDLHYLDEDGDSCGYCDETWPCPTVRLLRPLT